MDKPGIKVNTRDQIKKTKKTKQKKTRSLKYVDTDVIVGFVKYILWTKTNQMKKKMK